MATATLNSAGLPVPVGYMVVFSLSKRQCKKVDARELEETIADYVNCHRGISNHINSHDSLSQVANVKVVKSSVFVVKCNSEFVAKSLINSSKYMAKQHNTPLNLWTTFPIIGGMKDGTRT